MRRVIGYIRVSTTEQATEGFGLAVQRKAIQTYCKANGLRLLDIASDEGLSGSNGLDTRPGLAAAIVRIEDHEASALVVYRMDRLARDLMLQETIIAKLRQADANVLSVTEADIDSEEPTRVMVRQILGAVAQYERATIRQRVTRGKAEKQAQGGYAGGRPRYGYRAQDKALEADESEQEAVALARRLHGEKLSLRQIGAKLAEAGYQPKAGEQWHPNQVRRILARTSPPLGVRQPEHAGS
jgi:DNA invertase Pin-like site-specific DNA recombinase